ncbi:class I SAM-dependent methyltransferase [Brevundimonas sp. PAMC22021]|uniref:class I SAM-dependent methyltransferase n=1 Tax=Brevundimonas sp. PAMC22021 TaxID=2861285 RepID=UPI001C62CEBC|nr:class I SAM-dependent methyltransferase [Brevundimonas sp. PAMC22021]QYF86431.1 class I SAM-dependent methyltransferase [Brevundimonas sp. PAMC22021]
MHSNYYDLGAVRQSVEASNHREVIGGLWDEIGAHQMSFLVSQGMAPSDRLLDVGCGSLRLGSRAIAWLDPHRYYGTDLSPDLIEAGRQRELDDTLRAKAPSEHFSVSDDFAFSFLDHQVDLAIAQSVFTHLPLNHLRRCLHTLSPHMKSGGKFFVTYFDCPSDVDLHQPRAQGATGIVSHDISDPYHYRSSDLAWAIADSPWTLNVIGDWGHPRNQHMAAFIRH